MLVYLKHKTIRYFVPRIRRQLISVILATTSISGCSMASPQALPGRVGVDTYTGVLPKSSPSKTITSFTEALQCMDNLLETSDTPELLVSLAPAYAIDGSVTGIEDMLMTSLSTMALESNAIKVVANNPNDDPFYQHSEKQSFRAPDFFIRMSAPQFEDQVKSKDSSGSLQVPLVPLDAQIGNASDTSIVSIDMNMGQSDNLQLIPGIFSRNSIKVFNSRINGSASIGDPTQGSFDDFDTESEFDLDEFGTEDIVFDKHLGGMGPLSSVGRITKFGIDFQMNFNYREGRHAAVRTLIELGVIELIGKHTKLPYQNCLTGDSAEKLPIPKNNSPLADTTPDMPNNTTLQLLPKDTSTPVSYQHGDELKLTLTTPLEAYVFCYYQLHTGDIHQIFPTQYHSTNLLPANTSIDLPGDDRLKITIDSPGPDEKIQCIAHAPDQIGGFPEQLTVKNFEKLPMTSLQQLFDLHRLHSSKHMISDTFVISPY